MNLFDLQVPENRVHLIFSRLLEEPYAPERQELQRWAEGFVDRDGKFLQELQLSFESSFWELYLYAALKELGLSVDFSHHAPDFVVASTQPFTLEATIAAPAVGGKPAYGYTADDIPSDFSQFNVESTLRLCNSFSSKVKRYRQYYSQMPHVIDRPYVIAMASFDRPLAHLASARPILAALYGLYHDEAATPKNAQAVVSYNVAAAVKNEQTNIDVALFCDDTYSDVSAVVFSPVATWGKLRALADSPKAETFYTTYHPNEGSLLPKIRHTHKRDYTEHLLDGLMVLHNPFAKHPLSMGTLAHPRIAQIRPAEDGELITEAPDDFLLLRTLQSVVEKSSGNKR